MSFNQALGSIELLAQVCASPAEAVAVVGHPILVDLKRGAALLPMPSVPSYANYPPAMPCWFFAYGRSFNVRHTFRTEDVKAKSPTQIETFTIEMERELPYFKRRRILSLCREAISGHIGEDYFGHAYEVAGELVPKRLTLSEQRRVQELRERILSLQSR